MTTSGQDQTVAVIVLTRYDFHIILDMHWLHTQSDNVDCYWKIFQLNPHDHFISEFFGKNPEPS